MSKIIAHAECDGFAGAPGWLVNIAATRDGGARFYAPGWRAMRFATPDAAQRKLATHPGFKGWRSDCA